MSEAFCHACYGTSLTFENGVLVCDSCGTQTQVFQEETEFQQGIDDVRGRRRAAGSNAASQQPSQAAMIAQEEQKAAQQLKDAAMLYVRCLQHLLKSQGQALVTRFGSSPDLPSLLRQLWLSHIPTTGILEPKPHRALRTRAGFGAAAGQQQLGRHGDDGGGEGAGGDASEEEQEEQGQQQQQQGGRGLAGMRAAQLVEPHNMKRLLWKLLHPQMTLQLCFLGCVLLREAVTFHDVMTWALDGQLPFLELPHLSMQLDTGDALSCLPVRCLQPQLLLDPLAFCNQCCQLAGQLGLQLPHVAGEALLLRSTKELGLPQVVYEAALQLYCLYLLDTADLQLVRCAGISQALPYAWLAAVVLVAIKLLYGLGTAAGQLPLVPKAPGPPGGWLAWAHQALQQLPGISSLPLSEQEALQLGPSEVRQYIQFCGQYMFAGQPIVSTMDDVQRLLAGWYDAADPAGAQLQQQQQPFADGHPSLQLQAAGQAPAAAAAAAAPQQHAPGQQEQQQPPPDQQQAAPLPNPSNSTPGVSTYSLTALGLGASSGTARLEPDLAAVILVLAGYARVRPIGLVDCVRRLEKQMVAVESALKVMDQMQGARAAG